MTDSNDRTIRENKTHKRKLNSPSISLTWSKIFLKGGNMLPNSLSLTLIKYPGILPAHD
jgi:hypothetical protein